MREKYDGLAENAGVDIVLINGILRKKTCDLSLSLC